MLTGAREAATMRLDDYLDFLEPDVIRLKGHRIGLEDLVERYTFGVQAGG